MLLYSNFKNDPFYFGQKSNLNRVESKNIFISHNGNSNEIAQHNTSLYLMSIIKAALIYLIKIF